MKYETRMTIPQLRQHISSMEQSNLSPTGQNDLDFARKLLERRLAGEQPGVDR